MSTFHLLHAEDVPDRRMPQARPTLRTPAVVVRILWRALLWGAAMGAVVGSGFATEVIAIAALLDGGLAHRLFAVAVVSCGLVLGWRLGRQWEQAPHTLTRRVTTQRLLGAVVGAIAPGTLIVPFYGSLFALYGAVLGAFVGVQVGALVGSVGLLLLGGSLVVRRPSAASQLVLRARIIGAGCAPLAFLVVTERWTHAFRNGWPSWPLSGAALALLALVVLCAVIGWVVSPRVVTVLLPAPDPR